MSNTLFSTRFLWTVGVLIVLCNVLCLTYAGTARGSVVYSRSIVPNSSARNYSDSGFMRRSMDMGHPKIGAESRSVNDPHGRTLIFKSLILAPLAMVLFILFLILLIPIPVISNPVGRSLPSSSSGSRPYNTLLMAREVLTAEECMERLSCELSRVSRTYEYTSWIPSTLEKFLAKNKWSERILRGMKGTSNPSCYQFTCRPTNTIKRSLNM